MTPIPLVKKVALVKKVFYWQAILWWGVPGNTYTSEIWRHGVLSLGGMSGRWVTLLTTQTNHVQEERRVEARLWRTYGSLTRKKTCHLPWILSTLMSFNLYVPHPDVRAQLQCSTTDVSFQPACRWRGCASVLPSTCLNIIRAMWGSLLARLTLLSPHISDTRHFVRVPLRSKNEKIFFWNAKRSLKMMVTQPKHMMSLF